MPKNNVTTKTIRVSAGKYRGRKLNQPSKEITRPTMSRVKEAIFNMIQFDIEGSICLDIFSGSGSLSIEAVSRGAMKVVSVDKSQEAINVMQSNISDIGINNIDVVKRDVISYIQGAHGLKFDFIFMDPPFKEYGLYNQVFEELATAKLLNNTGYIILETNNPSKLVIPEGFVIRKQKKYGISTVLMLANNI